MENSAIFSRTHVDSFGRALSGSTYNFMIGMTLLWGFAVNALILNQVNVVALFQRFSPLMFFIGYFVLCMAGIWLTNRARNPLVAFLGYNMIVVPMGVIVAMAVTVAMEDPYAGPAVVREAVLYTGGATAAMMLLGTLHPRFFERISSALFISLLCVIGVEIIGYFFFGSIPAWTDWVIVLLFCGYIGLDWSRANAIPPTACNAIASAAAIYIDVINLFLAILRILSRNRD